MAGSLTAVLYEEMKVGRPFGAALRREASNHPPLHWLKTVVANGAGKVGTDPGGVSRRDERWPQCGLCRPKRRNCVRRHQNQGIGGVLGSVWGISAYCHGVRVQAA